MLLEGKVVVITGASRGIGRAVALGCAREGADVVVNDLSGPDAEVVQEIRALGRRAVPAQGDVADPETGGRLVAVAVDAFGKLDVPRLGLCRGPHWDDAQPEGRTVLETAADRLASAGAMVRDTELPQECAKADDIQRTLGSFEGLRNHMPELYRHEALLSRELRDEKISQGRRLTLDDFRSACRGAERARAAAREWAGSFDAILTLPAPGQAPRGLASTGSAIFNSLWTQLWMPCLTLPAGTGPEGLPVGIQLVGRRHEDARLLDVGLWVESRLNQGGQP